MSLIVAMDRTRAIGAGGKIPWHLTGDLKRFRQLTMGHAVVMGRKTFESIGKPLEGRRNIVVTRRSDYTAPGCTVVHTLEEGLRVAGPDAFVIGGAEIYAQALPLAQTLYITEVDTQTPGADTFFPSIEMKEWTLTGEEVAEPDPKNPFRCRFKTYARPKV